MSATNRRLAAIMVADVVGYSRMMEQDEAGTLARSRNGPNRRRKPGRNGCKKTRKEIGWPHLNTRQICLSVSLQRHLDIHFSGFIL